MPQKSDQDGVATPKADEDPTKQPNEAGIVFFEASVSKVVKDEDGNDVVVMSDHIGPGERLLSEVQAEKADREADESRKGSDDAKSGYGSDAKASAAKPQEHGKAKADPIDQSKGRQPGR